MKKIYKDGLVEIKKSSKRFISIILIVLLGVGFYCGLKASSPDMRNTLNSYINEQEMFDIEIISTLGLTKNDITAISNIKNIENVNPSISFDALVKIDDEELVFKVHSYTPDINKLVLVDGKLPENSDEVVIESSFFRIHDYKLGDIIEIKLDSNNISLKNKEVKIVGVVNSPLYISMTRESSSLGSGTVNYYLYMVSDNIECDYYTEIYLNVTASHQYFSYSKTYEKKIDEVIKEVENLGLTQSDIRYNEILDEANEKISEAEDELNSAKKKLKTETKNAQAEINKAKKSLEDSRLELNNLKELNDNYQGLVNKINENNELILNTSDPSTLYRLNYENSILEQNKLAIENGLSSQNIEVNNLDTLIKESETKISSGETELKTAQEKLNNETTKANKKINEAEKKLQEEAKKLDDIKEGEWYILNRDANLGYTSYLQDADRLEKIAVVFPIVFFVVAALVCLTSMTRMVDEQRLMIGTLKSLGYSTFAIAFKYVLYALLACAIGSVLGCFIGFNTIPVIVGNIYQMMYAIPDLQSDFILYYAILGFIVALISTVGATLYSTIKSLKEKPAMLMRPKSPEKGKRVFLEKIKFIWKKLKFTQKVTVRNLFRYKKRFYMTIIGIAGCTALITAGFGLRDSISGLIPNQYNRIFKYDVDIAIKDNYEKINNELLNNVDIKNTLGVMQKSIEITNISNNQNINLFVPDNITNFDDFISLNDLKNNKYLLNDNEIIITDKLSRILDVKIGDNLVLKLGDEKSEVKITGISENYVMHYVYMNKTTYENLFKEKYEVNDIYALVNFTKDENDTYVKNLLASNKDIAAVRFLNDTMVTYNDIMDNMKTVAWILVISAAMLAFVVLFNLANVNISERKKEIATIKVLGFFDKEVYHYITREIYILAIIGIPIGLVMGYILTTYVVKTCELDMVTFRTIINPTSYLIAVAFTFIFTIIVNIITYFILKKIDMIESLKSVE